MKLFTEKQVRQSFIAGMEFIAVDPLKYEQDANEYMNSITPIELPSDEKIDEKSNFLFPNANRIGSSTYIAYKGFIEGAIWMKTQILNQNL